MNGLTILLFLIFVLLAVTLIVGLIILRIALQQEVWRYVGGLKRNRQLHNSWQLLFLA
jgi:hypothetical protein